MTYDRCHIADGCGGDEVCSALCPQRSAPKVEPFPHQQYPTRDEWDAISAALESGARRITRELVHREEQQEIWALSGEAIVYFATMTADGLPVSGDDRPDIRRGRIRP